MTERPLRTGKPVAPISITGYLMPVRTNGQPIYLQMPGSDKLYIPVFANKERIEELWKAAPLTPYDRVVIITNGREFLASIRENKNDRLVVIADPYMLPNQRVRFVQIFQDGDEIPSDNPN